jgi:murein DD-endopeptidase MepM/ murein hydrolase activator NlpD
MRILRIATSSYASAQGSARGREVDRFERPRQEIAIGITVHRRAAIALFALAPCVACKPETKTIPPQRVEEAMPQSALLPRADELIDAMTGGDVARIRSWMTRELRGRVRLHDLESASLRLRNHFGPVVGILEESLHREGDLEWYSGLVVHGRPGHREVTPMLYQFATNRDGSLARLLVREHWLVETLREPDAAYMPVTRFRFPADGEWTITHGGPRRSTNAHHGSRTQRFGYDIVVKKNGRSRRPGSDKKRNASYYAHGQPLRAPAAGTIVRVVDGVRENVPGERGEAGGNGVVIDHGFGEYSHLWHMIPGSVRVKEGDRVKVGQQLGLVGNSGRSTNPHIHFHVQSRRDSAGAVALPAPFVEVWVNGRWTPRRMPVRGDRVERERAVKPARRAHASRVLLDV